MLRSTILMAASLALLLPACSTSSDNANVETDAGPDDVATAQDVTAEQAAADGASEAAADVTTEEAGAACTAIIPDAGVGPGGYPLDGWNWKRRGIVLQDSTATAKQDGFIAPAAVVVGDTIHLWLTRKQGTTHRIQHTSSTDGATFSAPVEVTGLAGDNTMYPSVIHDAQGYSMWYGSGLIDRAQSQDGVAWTMVAEGVLKTGADGEFDNLSLLYPSVIRTASGYVMYYTGWNGGPFAIGRAESTDGTSWTRNPQGPLLQAGSATDFDNHAVAQPCAVVSGTGVRLWYGGYDTSKANPGPYRIGLAQSSDGLAFQRKGVSLDLEASGQEAWSTRDPAVVRWKDRWWMAYVAMGDDAIYRIAVAESDACP
jgi:predicted GH43/DUF377 family glycosyl hydrolase